MSERYKYDPETFVDMPRPIPDGLSVLSFVSFGGIKNDDTKRFLLYANELQPIHVFDYEGQLYNGRHMEGGRLRSDLIHFDSALQMSPHPTIFQGLGRWFVGAGGYGNKVSRYLMPVPTISEGGPISVEADNWGLFPKVEEGSHVDLLVGEQKFRIEIPPLGQEGVFKIDGESDVQLPLFRSFTFRSAEPTEPGVVLEAPAIKVSPLGRIISLPFGIALHAHSRMDATRSLIS